jgi:transcriptional regulator with XRE-family HTH domain
MYGNKLKSLVKKKGITQKELSRILEIPESSTSVWLNSEYPPLEFIQKCCEFFDMELWRFFAPDDLVVPQMSDNLKNWTRVYQSLPEDLQLSCLRVVEHFLEAYVTGKGGKLHKSG